MARSRAGRIVVGLGNPGREYESTPHNVGFHAVERLARERGCSLEPSSPSNRLRGARWPSVARGSFDPDALLVRPETYMNRSGTVVAPVARSGGARRGRAHGRRRRHGPAGRELRIRPHGGAGGHNGHGIDHRIWRGWLPAPAGGDRHAQDRGGASRPPAFPGGERRGRRARRGRSRRGDPRLVRSGDLEHCMSRYHSRWNQGAERSCGAPRRARESRVKAVRKACSSSTTRWCGQDWKEAKGVTDRLSRSTVAKVGLPGGGTSGGWPIRSRASGAGPISWRGPRWPADPALRRKLDLSEKRAAVPDLGATAVPEEERARRPRMPPTSHPAASRRRRGGGAGANAARTTARRRRTPRPRASGHRAGRGARGASVGGRAIPKKPAPTPIAGKNATTGIDYKEPTTCQVPHAQGQILSRNRTSFRAQRQRS